MLMGNGQYFPFLSLLGEWRTGVLENQYSSFTSYWDNRKFIRFGFLWCSVSVCLCVSVFVWCESRANSMKRRKEYTHEWWNLIRSGVKPKEWQWNERSAIEMGIIHIWQTSAYIDEDAMNVPELFVGNCNAGTEREKVFIHGYIFFLLLPHTMQRSNIRTKSLVLRYLIVNCCDSRLLFPACARLPNRQLTAFYSSRLPLTHVHTASGIIHTASYSILFDEAVFASFRSRTFGASVCVCVLLPVIQPPNSRTYRKYVIYLLFLSQPQ